MSTKFEFEGGRTLTVDADNQRVDAYFGHATETPEESTALAEWIFESFEKGTEGNEKPFCVVADMSDLDDSTLTSDGAKVIYTKQVLANERIDHFIFVTRSHGMKMLLGLLVRISGRAARIHVVDTKKAAEEAFQKWQESQQA